MNEDNNAISNNEAFESLLRTIRPTAPCNVEETFFQAGWAAALKQHGVSVVKQDEQPLGKRLALGGWSTFSSGLVAGLVAGLLAAVIWLRPIESGANNQRIAEEKITAPVQPSVGARSIEQIVSSDNLSSRHTTELIPQKESHPFVWDTVAWLTQLATGVSDQPAISDSPKRLTARFVDAKQFNDTLRWTPSRADASISNGTDSPSVILKYHPMQPDSLQDLL